MSTCQMLYYTPIHPIHYNDVIMSAMVSTITSLTIVYSTVYSGADQRKHQSSASLAFVRGIHRWPVNSPHKGSVTRKMFPFNDVIMLKPHHNLSQSNTVIDRHTCRILTRDKSVRYYIVGTVIHPIINNTLIYHSLNQTSIHCAPHLSWWCYDMGILSALLALCEGNLPFAGRFPPQRASHVELWCFLWY